MTARSQWTLVSMGLFLAGCAALPAPPQSASPEAAPLAPPEPPTLARGPVVRGSPANWFTTNDYPARALREERQGAATARLTIGLDGRPSACAIEISSGHDMLDTATCSYLMRRARFEPALDDAGQPTDGTFTAQIMWRLPYDVLTPLPQAGSLTTSIVFDRNGTGGQCRVLRSSGELAARNPVGPQYCQPIYTGTPVTDRRGRPISRTYVTRLDVRIRAVAHDFAPRPASPATIPVRNMGYRPPLTGRIVRSFIVEVDGKQSNCRIISASGEMAEGLVPGTYECSIGEFAGPYVNADGRPERRMVTITEQVRMSEGR